MDRAFAEQFARSWYAAWNSNDLERILSLYADDVELPGLRFEPRELLVGVDSLVLHYVSADGRLAAEVVCLNEEGKISR